MKKLIITTACFVIICLTLSFGILPNISKAYNSPEDPTSNESYSAESAASSSSNSSSKLTSSLTYVVKNFNGNIAIFESGAEKPFKITDVQVNTLPQKDQELLNKGIVINDKSELSTLLEDLCS